MVFFDKVVDKTTAETAANYTVDNSINIISAALDSYGRTVTLTASTALSTSTEYKITVKNVKDMAKSPNTMDDLVNEPFTPKSLDALIGYWNFDVLGHEKVKDLSTMGIDGTILQRMEVNYSAGRVPGYRGNGCRFDGDDMFDITDWATDGIRANTNAAYNGDSGTIAFWFKAYPYEFFGPFDQIAEPSRNDFFYKMYAFESYYKGDELYVSDNGGGQASGVTVTDGQWHHFAWTYKRNATQGAKLYIDGGLKFTLNNIRFLDGHVNSGIGFGAGGGGYGNGSYNGMNGILDEIMVFDRPLNWPEVVKVYNTGWYLGTHDQAQNLDRDKELEVRVYPNPFSTSVNIQVLMRNDECGMMNINVCIFDITGRQVARFEQFRTPHSALGNSYTWDARNQSSGIYFVKIKAGNKVLIRKIGLLR
jgi:hypothetical protein